MGFLYGKVIPIAAALCVSGAALAQQTVDLGKREYGSSCASCHGLSGKGDGPLRAFLVKAPSDLTTLAKRNGGTFPAQAVSEIIDGRTSTEIGTHGSREMPVWGHEYQVQALQEGGMPYAADWYARGRVLALVDYLARIQVK